MSQKPIVVVTGASGFIASRIVHDLRTTQKYQVRGTVRNASDPKKIEFLKNLGDVQIAEGDLTVEGSFDKAFEGASFVIHSASPFLLSSSDPENDLYKPAVNGTKSVLNSCLKNGVKRVVLTSSMASIIGSQRRRDPKHQWVEEDWNSDALQRTSFASPYVRSKTLAELAAWEFVSQHPEIELVVINPSFVLGPPVVDRLEPTSIQIPKGIFEGTLNPIPNWTVPTVDLRAVSQAHVNALEVKPANQRFILSNTDEISMLDFSKLIKDLFPDWPVSSEVAPDGRPSEANVINNSKAREILGVEFYPLEKTLKEMFDELIRIGLVKKP
eukprot:TRINITY_DN510_c0_g1_i2.p1 TRINITY_DN510_c0_g1~~TRINITY_DN510_c0_g1_i2.p1  ORF type:complete len:359 (-),score=92.44 TRINITY_DN510_c0_g1_i2:54-1034(-)